MIIFILLIQFSFLFLINGGLHLRDAEQEYGEEFNWKMKYFIDKEFVALRFTQVCLKSSEDEKEFEEEILRGFNVRTLLYAKQLTSTAPVASEEQGQQEIQQLEEQSQNTRVEEEEGAKRTEKEIPKDQSAQKSRRGRGRGNKGKRGT